MELTLAESGSTLRSNVSNLEIDKQESEQLMSNPRLQQTVLPVTALPRQDRPAAEAQSFC